jgi:cytochrome b561
MQTDSLSGHRGRRAYGPWPSHHGGVQYTAIDTHRPSYDGLTIALHWATAVLVLALFATAWLHALAEEHKSDFTPLMLQMHRSIGVIVWAFAALRLTWRLTWARLPPFSAQMTARHRAMVKLSEYGLYTLLLGQPATGLLMTLFGGRPFVLLAWQIPPLLPRDEAIRAMFHSAHELGAWTLAILVAGHAGMALFHHFVLRDDVLVRMAPGVATLRAGKEF